MVDAERSFPPTTELIYYQHRTSDQVVVFDGQTYRDQAVGPNGPPLESFDPAEYVEVGRLRQHDCQFGFYPWDYWHTWAIAAGVPHDLADLGRALVREADQHNWSAELQHECGWNDSGAAMIRLALEQPDQARDRWRHLLETDGERV